MKNKLIFPLCTALLLAVLFHGCQKQPVLKALVPDLPSTPYNYEPCNSSSCNGNSPVDNRVTNDGATLGRLLFYDPRLSLNNTVSCASCHRQENAFADVGQQSTGFEGMVTPRNTPAIINARNKSSFFWDGRTALLEEMVLMPVKNHVEMGLDRLEVMERKIASVSYYPELFKKAFGTEEVTHNKIARALAQFIRAIKSDNSKADNNQLNATEITGRNVFSKFSCGNCHRGNDFSGDALFIPYHGTAPKAGSANIGLDLVYSDKGIAAIDGNEASEGAFIIPSLRNLEFTAPYMHDGRYGTLDEVIEHYNSGILPHPALDVVLTDTATGFPVIMAMTESEKESLKAFLLALSDRSVTSDVRFSNPFK